MTIYEGILKKRLSDSLSKQLHELSWKNIITRPLQGPIWPIWSKPFCSWIALNTGDGCFIKWYFWKYNQSYFWPISQLLHPLDQGALCRIHHCLCHEHFKKVQFAFTQRPNLHTYLHLELPCIYISIPLPCNWTTLGEPPKQIFGKSWEFGPTGLTPPPRTLGFFPWICRKFSAKKGQICHKNSDL